MNLRPDQLAARLQSRFDENFSDRGELGAALSIWHRGESVLELAGGYRDARREMPWTNDTLVLLWSATKGLGSACLLHLLQEREISLERRVAEFWPEFGEAGKEQITLAQLLSHQAGLCALDEVVEVTDYAAVVRALEKQKPLWPPGTAHGYHARTFGFLVQELLRRIGSRSVAEYWRASFAEPLQL
ncbi:MAG TPA: serine hydrolase domain-containing protein, partial [Chthoniobacterales bacterium]